MYIRHTHTHTHTHTHPTSTQSGGGQRVEKCVSPPPDRRRTPNKTLKPGRRTDSPTTLQIRHTLGSAKKLQTRFPVCTTSSSPRLGVGRGKPRRHAGGHSLSGKGNKYTVNGLCVRVCGRVRVWEGPVSLPMSPTSRSSAPIGDFGSREEVRESFAVSEGRGFAGTVTR